MRFNIYKETCVSLYILAFILMISMIFYFFASMFTSMGYNGLRSSVNAESESVNENKIIIIDAGHGGEDPGASANGLVEKDLNLDLSFKLKAILESCGYEVALTRSDDRLLYNVGEEKRKKYYDLRNREVIAEEYTNSIFVSVHMNKFPAEYCKGLQTFYSGKNSDGKLLAESIQENARYLQKSNKRVAMAGEDTIYLLENLDMPAVLIECGFLSNNEEALLLADSEYRVALAFTIYCGIVDFLEKN